MAVTNFFESDRLRFVSRNTRLILAIGLIPLLLYVEWHKSKDFYVYLRGAQDLISDRDIYGPTTHVVNLRYFYSPFFAWILSPFAFFSWKMVASVWTLAQLGLFFWLLKELRQYLPALNTLAVAIVWAILSLRPIFYNIDLGQVNLAILVSTLCAIRWMTGERWLFGAALLALGIAIKPVSFVILGYLVYRGYFRNALASIIFIAIFSVLPSVTLGFPKTFGLIQEWFQVLLQEDGHLSYEDRAIGIHGLCAQLLRFSIPISWVEMLLAFVRGGFMIAAVIVVGRPGSSEKPSLASISYLLLTMTLISPHQQKYALVTLAPAYAVMLHAIISQGLAKARWSAILVALSFVLCTLTSDGFIGRRAYEMVNLFRPMTVGAMILLLALFLEILSGRSRQPST